MGSHGKCHGTSLGKKAVQREKQFEWQIISHSNTDNTRSRWVGGKILPYCYMAVQGGFEVRDDARLRLRARP